jgi:dynein heavy chain
MSSPPIGVKMVMEAVCLLLGVEPKRVKPDPTRPLEFILDYWEPAKKVLLGDPKLIQRLVEFDRDHVEPRAIRAVSEFIADPLLEPDSILRVRLPMLLRVLCSFGFTSPGLLFVRVR